jgi:hypothetical protein
MRKVTKALLLGLVLTIGLLGAACPERTNIGRIEANPSRYFDKQVAVAGRVTDGYGVSIPIIGQGGGAYKIDDGTGSVWVITQRSVPSKGARLGLKGRVQNGGVFGGRNYGLVIVEDDRRFDRSK